MLAETIEYYRDFAEQAKDEPQLRADLALTYSKIAALLEDHGSLDEALVAHEQARDLFARLAGESPGAGEHRRDLALCWNNLARTLGRQGRFADARDAQGAAIRLQTQLVESLDDAAGRTDLALSYSNLGMLELAANNTSAAEQAFHEAIRLQTDLVVREPTQPAFECNLGNTYNNLAGLYAEGDPHRASDLFQQAIRHLRAAVAAQPAEVAFQEQLASTYCNLGSAHSRGGSTAEAAEDYASAAEIQERLVAARPAEWSPRRDLAVTRNNQGLMLSEAGEHEQAEKYFHEAIALQEVLVAQYPRDASVHSKLAGSYNNLGIVFEALHCPDQAAPVYERAVAHQRTAHAAAPDVDRYRSFLSKHYFNYGRVLRLLGRGAEAGQAALPGASCGRTIHSTWWLSPKNWPGPRHCWMTGLPGPSAENSARCTPWRRFNKPWLRDWLALRTLWRKTLSPHSATETNFPRRYGSSRKGQRCRNTRAIRASHAATAAVNAARHVFVGSNVSKRGRSCPRPRWLSRFSWSICAMRTYPSRA